MPTVVVVLPSTTYRAGDFVAAAGSLGVDLVVASEEPPPMDMGDRYVHIDCSDPNEAARAIVEAGDRIGIDGIVAADDAGVEVAAIAGQTLGLKANPPQAAAATRDKAAQRALLGAAEVPQPRFALVEPDDDPAPKAADIGYPVVIKPLDRSAGQGVIRVDESTGLEEAVRRVRAIVGDQAPVLVEEFLDGPEVAVEGLVSDGVLNVLTIFDKPYATEGPFFPETILVTPSSLEPAISDECVRVAQAALSAIGIRHGSVHVELKVGTGRVSVIEVAARSIGGLCSRTLSFGLLGTTLETLILRNALGTDKPELRRERAASGVLMIPIPRPGRFARLEHVQEARRLPGVTGIDLTVPAGRMVLPPPEGDRYLGFLYARGESPQAVTDSLRRAEELLEVVME